MKILYSFFILIFVFKVAAEELSDQEIINNLDFVNNLELIKATEEIPVLSIGTHENNVKVEEVKR